MFEKKGSANCSNEKLMSMETVSRSLSNQQEPIVKQRPMLPPLTESILQPNILGITMPLLVNQRNLRPGKKTLLFFRKDYAATHVHDFISIKSLVDISTDASLPSEHVPMWLVSSYDSSLRSISSPELLHLHHASSTDAVHLSSIWT